jgi:hypothetical protein
MGIGNACIIGADGTTTAGLVGGGLGSDMFDESSMFGNRGAD